MGDKISKEKLERIVEESNISKEEKRVMINAINDAIERKILFEFFLDQLPVGVIVSDSEGKVVYVNRKCDEIFGKSFRNGRISKAEELREFYKARVLGTKRDYPRNKSPLLNALNGKSFVADDIEITTPEGVKKIVKIVSSPIYLNEKLKYAVDIVDDISHLFRDEITGLYNMKYVNIKLEKLREEKLESFGVALFDINGLKRINELFGKRAGDELLKTFSSILEEVVDEKYVVAKIDGGKFAVLVENSSEEELREIVSSVDEKVKRLGDGNGSKSLLSVTSSYSYAKFSKGMKVYPLELFQKAENQLYKEETLNLENERSVILKMKEIIMNFKDESTEEHQKRVEELLVKFAREINYDEEKIYELRLLAQFHDIGKIVIPDYILKKPGKLTREEYDIVKEHAEIGYEIASRIDELSSIADYIRYHHERWDGNGYPKGLKDGEIPLESRMLAIVDAYDAITAGRVYQKPRSKEEAIKELRANAGTQFDPELTEKFIRMLKKRRRI